MDNEARSRVLETLNLGSRIAEQEANELASYFVETNQWKAIYEGKADVVYGTKGSGKSALYATLFQNADTLAARGIMLIAAENPKGATAFKQLGSAPPSDESAFVDLWKLYLLCLIVEGLRARKVSNEPTQELIAVLSEAQLIQMSPSLSSTLKEAFSYVISCLKWQSVQSTLELDPQSGLPKGLTGKITFRETSAAEKKVGLISVDSLLSKANDALRKAHFSAWLALDRLDVAFAGSPALESRALGSLFRVYLDLQSYSNVALKIFLRDDIWKRIIASGFREASHIEKAVTISWSESSLLNLVTRRLITSSEVLSRVRITEKDANGIEIERAATAVDVLASARLQSDTFYSIFTNQVDQGDKKSTTFDWILSRTKDGVSKISAPREVIHLVSESRAKQIDRIAIGLEDGLNDRVIGRAALREALPVIAQARYNQTLLAEYPQFSVPLEKLRGQKTEHTVGTLSEVWGVTVAEASKMADELHEAGFFGREGPTTGPKYSVPFIYRSALEMIQGKAYT